MVSQPLADIIPRSWAFFTGLLLIDKHVCQPLHTPGVVTHATKPKAHPEKAASAALIRTFLALLRIPAVVGLFLR
jgi:hypothetical protein